MSHKLSSPLQPFLIHTDSPYPTPLFPVSCIPKEVRQGRPHCPLPFPPISSLYMAALHCLLNRLVFLQIKTKSKNKRIPMITIPWVRVICPKTGVSAVAAKLAVVCYCLVSDYDPVQGFIHCVRAQRNTCSLFCCFFF